VYFRRLILISIFFGYGVCFSSEQTELDSLFNLGKELSGEDKVHNLINISRQYMIMGDSLSIVYANKAIELAQQIDYIKGEGMAYLFLAISYDGKNDDLAIKYYKQSSDILDKIDHPWTAFGYENSATIYLGEGLVS
jgi:hypothetical protein